MACADGNTPSKGRGNIDESEVVEKGKRKLEREEQEMQ